VIHEVDKALRIVIGGAPKVPEGLRINFETPTSSWSSGLDGTPTVNLFLYDIREDTKQRKVGQTPMRNDRNRIVGWRPPPRIYKLSYIATCWAGATEAEHEMLGWLLQTLSGIKQLPAHSLTGSLAIWGLAAMEVSQPTPDQRPPPGSLTALTVSGEARPNLDIIVSAPIVFPATEASGLVLEELILEAQGKRGQPFERVQRRWAGGIAELERTPPGQPLTEKSRAGEPEEEIQLREDDPERGRR
jgi:hypothetical protein